MRKSLILGTIDPGWRVVAVADLDVDGRPDIIVQNRSSFDVAAWLMGDPDGTGRKDFVWLSNPGKPGWQVAAVADFDSDGKPDILWNDIITRQILLWFMGGPKGDKLRKSLILRALDPGWRVVAVADLDGNDKPDIILQNDSSLDVAAWLMGGPDGLAQKDLIWLSKPDKPGWQLAAI